MSVNDFILDVYSAIETYLKNNWADTNNIDWVNTSTKNLTVPYIRPRFIPLANVREEIGSGGASKFDCILSIDVFVEKGIGTYESSVMISNIMELFNEDNIPIITDYGREINFLPPQPLNDKDGVDGLWQSTVHCPFYVFNR